MYQEYSQKTVHFLGTDLSAVLSSALKGLGNDFSLIDLGCGDGATIYALYSNGLLKNATDVVGVDLSPVRIKRLTERCPFVKGVVADVCDLAQIPDNSFDFVISSQVIEHVPNDAKMLSEVHRIIKPQGLLYISTVVRKWYGVWIYWNKGFKLDPTHLKEYRSTQEFGGLLSDQNFKIIALQTNRVKYPILDLVLRLLVKCNLVELAPDYWLKHPRLAKIRGLFKWRIVGFETIEIVARPNEFEQTK